MFGEFFLRPIFPNDQTSNQCLCDLLGLGTNFFENSFHGLKNSFGEWTHFGSLGNPTRKPNGSTGSEFRYHQKGNIKRGYQQAIQNGSRLLFFFWNLSIHVISSPFWSYRKNNTYINGLEGKILTETIECPIKIIKIMGLKPVNFAFSTNPLIYIYIYFPPGYPMVFPHEIPILSQDPEGPPSMPGRKWCVCPGSFKGPNHTWTLRPNGECNNVYYLGKW